MSFHYDSINVLGPGQIFRDWHVQGLEVVGSLRPADDVYQFHCRPDEFHCLVTLWAPSFLDHRYLFANLSFICCIYLPFIIYIFPFSWLSICRCILSWNATYFISPEMLPDLLGFSSFLYLFLDLSTKTGSLFLGLLLLKSLVLRTFRAKLLFRPIQSNDRSTSYIH